MGNCIDPCSSLGAGSQAPIMVAFDLLIRQGSLVSYFPLNFFFEMKMKIALSSYAKCRIDICLDKKLLLNGDPINL